MVDVYQYTGEQWKLIAQLSTKEPSPFDFGASVAISENLIIIGAPPVEYDDNSYNEVIEKVSGMTVLELSECIKRMEEKFGVSAAAAAVAAGDR